MAMASRDDSHLCHHNADRFALEYPVRHKTDCIFLFFQKDDHKHEKIEL
jgi:hypothetical protein